MSFAFTFLLLWRGPFGPIAAELDLDATLFSPACFFGCGGPFGPPDEAPDVHGDLVAVVVELEHGSEGEYSFGLTGLAVRA